MEQIEYGFRITAKFCATNNERKTFVKNIPLAKNKTEDNPNDQRKSMNCVYRRIKKRSKMSKINDQVHKRNDHASWSSKSTRRE